MRLQIRSKVLDKIREEHGLTSDQALATHLGLSMGTVQKIRGGAAPSLPTFILIMDAANISQIDAGIIRSEAPAA